MEGNRSADSRKEEWKDRDKVFYCILPLYVWCYCLVWLFVKVREVNPRMEEKKEKKKKVCLSAHYMEILICSSEIVI